jgi:hypothetical protein
MVKRLVLSFLAATGTLLCLCQIFNSRDYAELSLSIGVFLALALISVAECAILLFIFLKKKVSAFWGMYVTWLSTGLLIVWPFQDNWEVNIVPYDIMPLIALVLVCLMTCLVIIPALKRKTRRPD